MCQINIRQLCTSPLLFISASRWAFSRISDSTEERQMKCSLITEVDEVPGYYREDGVITHCSSNTKPISAVVHFDELRQKSSKLAVSLSRSTATGYFRRRFWIEQNLPGIFRVARMLIYRYLADFMASNSTEYHREIDRHFQLSRPLPVSIGRAGGTQSRCCRDS